MGVSYDLNDALGSAPSYTYEGLDRVIRLLDGMDLVATYLSDREEPVWLACPRAGGGATKR